MSRAMVIVLALIVAFAAGTASVGYVMTHWLQIAGQSSGPWKRLIGLSQADADPYTRAFDHISGQLPLGSAEGQTYLASKDSDGNPLDGACNYSVAGEIPAARLFTLHAQTLEGLPIVAKAPLQGALHSDELLFHSDSFAISIAATAKPDNWLSLETTGPFTLVLTYYDVAVINDDTGNSTRLPSILKGSCAND